jgi:glycosyltransferase involved in cell wall biosynthesis
VNGPSNDSASDPAHSAAIAARGWRTPAFAADVFAARRTPFVTVIPVINEGERIRRQLREMSELALPQLVDTVLIDGGSTDGSLDHAFLRDVGVRALLTKSGPGKLSAQLRCAYAWALIEEYDGIITIDGNGKDGVEAIPAFAAALERGVDYAQASRFIRGGGHANTPLLRHLGIRLVHSPLQSIAARRWLTDTTQGFRAYSRRFLADPRTAPFRDVFQRYELLAYLTARAGQLGYVVSEIPTRRVYPRHSPAPTKIHGVGPQIDLILVALRALAGAYNPKPDE